MRLWQPLTICVRILFRNSVKINWLSLNSICISVCLVFNNRLHGNKQPLEREPDNFVYKMSIHVVQAIFFLFIKFSKILYNIFSCKISRRRIYTLTIDPKSKMGGPWNQFPVLSGFFYTYYHQFKNPSQLIP